MQMRSKEERKADYERREAERKTKFEASKARREEKSAELRAQLDERKAAKEQARDAGAAAEKEMSALFASMGMVSWKSVRKEMRLLPGILESGEQIVGAARGFMDNKHWLVVCTDRRVLFLDKVIGGVNQMDIPLETISSVSQKTGMVFGAIDILGAGLSGMRVEKIAKEEVPRLANAIQQARRELKNHNDP